MRVSKGILFAKDAPSKPQWRKRATKFVITSPIYIGVATYIVCFSLSIIPLPVPHASDFWFRFSDVALSWFRTNQCEAPGILVQLLVMDHLVLPISFAAFFPLFPLLATRQRRASYYSGAYRAALKPGKKKSWLQWPSTTALGLIAVSAWIFWMLFNPDSIFFENRAHAGIAPLAFCYVPRTFIATLGVMVSGGALFAAYAVILCLAIVEHHFNKTEDVGAGGGH